MFLPIIKMFVSFFDAILQREGESPEPVIIPVLKLFLEGEINSSQKAHDYRQRVLRPLVEDESHRVVIDLQGILHEDDMYIVDAFLLCGLSPYRYDVINRPESFRMDVSPLSA